MVEDNDAQAARRGAQRPNASEAGEVGLQPLAGRSSFRQMSGRGSSRTGAAARLPLRDLLDRPESVAAYLHLRHARRHQEMG